MIAFGTFKKKSAFKLYARSQNMNFDLANTISEQIDKYEEAIKYASDDEKDEIDIYDFVEPKYKDYIDKSKKYWGIVSDKKKAPCAFLLYNGNIREEIGLIKCKSESTGKEFLTAVVDGAIAENYKFLKNDILTVSVVLLIDKIYKEIGIKHHTVNELRKLVKDDDATWNIYKNGWTIGVNQCEQPSAVRKMMNFQAKNVSELSAWIAGIRPAFKSMYSKFEKREHFEYGIRAFDKLLQTEELPQSFILYQEQTMSVLNYAGFPLDECYGIIKAIAKKHPEKVKPLKSKFIDGFKNRIKIDDNISDEKANEMSAQVWEIIENSCGYGFNSAHAYCMALDSLYGAYLKAHYPYEFYKTLMQFHSDRGEKDKVSALKVEMQTAFHISEGPYKYGVDNRKFIIDKENQCIYPALRSLKGFNDECAINLYDIATVDKPKTFIELLSIIPKYKGIDKTRLDILIKLDYFSEFGEIGYLLNVVELYNAYYGKKILKKDKLNVPDTILQIIEKHSTQTDKQYKIIDSEAMINEMLSFVKPRNIKFTTRLGWEKEFLGYMTTTIDRCNGVWAVIDIDSKYSPKLLLYNVGSGKTISAKISKKDYQKDPVAVGDTLRLTIEQRAKSKLVDGEWVKNPEEMEDWVKCYAHYDLKG